MIVKKLIMLIAVYLAYITAIGQQQPLSRVIVTNLSDKLRTQVTIDLSTGIDIRRLNLDSIHADKHKSKHTTVKSLSINELKPRSVMMVKPLISKDESGKYIASPNVYVNTYALKKRDLKNIFIDDEKMRHILVKDLNPSLTCLNSLGLSKIGSHKMSCDPRAISIKSLNNDPISINGLQANPFDVKTLLPSIVNAIDSSKNVSVMVINNAKWHVDTSLYDIKVTEDTYAELTEMKLIYDFEQSYNESIKSEVKLNDIKQLDRKMYIKWINILANNRKCNIELIKNTKRRKIIGEAWIHDNSYDASVKQNMVKNLAYLKSKGYDTVLVRFRCSEDISQLKQMINDIKDEGFEVFSAFVGYNNGNPRWNPFIDPKTIEQYMNEIVPMCTGYLLNWRSTSNHVKILPIEYFNYLCNVIRRANDKILIYGEVYYGYIGPLRMHTMIYTAPENITGLVINNAGYYGYNITYIVNNLFSSYVPGYKKMDKIGQVIGASPYYCSKEMTTDNRMSLEKEYNYKDKVEKAFNRTKYGTITMLHDGVDDNYTSILAEIGSPKRYDTTDNILYDIKVWKMADEEHIIKNSNDAQK